MIYRFKSGTRYTKECDPQQIGESLESIRLSNEGRLHVQDVLTEAANPASALHPAFTWDDQEAAESWRTQEARQLIRAVVVAKTEEEEPTAAFYNIKIGIGEEVDQFYQSITVLEQSPREYQAALQGLLGQLDALDRSIKELRKVTPPTQSRQIDQASGFLARAKNVLNR